MYGTKLTNAGSVGRRSHPRKPSPVICARPLGSHLVSASSRVGVSDSERPAPGLPHVRGNLLIHGVAYFVGIGAELGDLICGAVDSGIELVTQHNGCGV